MACLLTVTWASLVSGYTGGPGLSWDEESFLALEHIPEIITRQLLECGDPLSQNRCRCRPWRRLWDRKRLTEVHARNRLGALSHLARQRAIGLRRPWATATSAAKCNPLIRATQQLRFHANCRAD